MKFVRYGRNGQEQPGLIDAQGRLRSLGGIVDEIDADVFGRPQALRGIDAESLPLVGGKPRLGV
ncbi:MAG: 2-hydroxyhepta-2,4-diene-1,7-dioate isomerase, partial [Betaproteobacteria bacterium]|nr:2-hydroxyhepta-2,4-diene-1,7-dioate isomerase [Betaproteobacteria bacterium]